MPSSTPNHPRRSNIEYRRHATRHAATTHMLIEVLKNSGASVSRPWLSLCTILPLYHVGGRKTGRRRQSGQTERMAVDLQQSAPSPRRRRATVMRQSASQDSLTCSSCRPHSLLQLLRPAEHALRRRSGTATTPAHMGLILHGRNASAILPRHSIRTFALAIVPVPMPHGRIVGCSLRGVLELSIKLSQPTARCIFHAGRALAVSVPSSSGFLQATRAAAETGLSSCSASSWLSHALQSVR